jgi:hypothetical protein
MGRELTSHKVGDLNDVLKIEVLDKPGPGGANHSYMITPTIGNAVGLKIDFQNGPLKETIYPNGLTIESLLAIAEDRLKGFQSGPFACRENALALTHIQKSMNWLHHRTRDRLQRGVEGTNQA